MTDTRRRVKLYALNSERQWDDRGTGHVSSSYVDRLKGISLLVRAEADGSLLLESKIQPDTAYQKQQDTLIVWSEGDNFDLALSFQEKIGCDEIWEKICQVQGKDPSVDITQDIIEESEDDQQPSTYENTSPAPPIDLPLPTDLQKLQEIHELIISCLPVPLRREKLALALEQDGYIANLCKLFHKAEEIGDRTGLLQLYHIVRSLFLLNKNSLFEIMFGDDLIFSIIGCLEHDPTNTKPHREYLRKTRYKKVLNIKNQELLSKIHQTYRVQYIHDSILPPPSAFEENMLSTLSSFIFFNKVEIVSLIQEDEGLLSELFHELSMEINESRRGELILFLKELCAFAQNLQPQAREAFYKTLTTHGILRALELSLPIQDPLAKTASIDVLTAVVEFSPTVVREYCIQQANSNNDNNSEDPPPLLLNVIIKQLINDPDPELGGAVQLSGVVRLLIDPENMLATLNKSEKADFLNLFYKQSMHVLIAPLLQSNTSADLKTAQLQWLLLELLSFCVEHHSYHIKSYIINKDLIRKFLNLMSSPHTFLSLGSLRLLRKVLALKDDLYNRYIVKGDLFKPVVEAFKRNGGRYNLLDSAVIELFEFIRGEDIKPLITHIVENYNELLDNINYVSTFKSLKLKYEQNQERLKEKSGNSTLIGGSTSTTTVTALRSSGGGIGSNTNLGKFRRDPRQLDEDEELWFENDDDEDGEDEEEIIENSSGNGSDGSESGNGSGLSCLGIGIAGGSCDDDDDDDDDKVVDDDLETIGKLLDKKSDRVATTAQPLPITTGQIQQPPPSTSSTTGSGGGTTSQQPPQSTTTNLVSNNNNKKSMFQQIFASLQESVTQATQIGLVDYEGSGDSDNEEDDEEDDVQGGGGETPTDVKRPRLS